MYNAGNIDSMNMISWKLFCNSNISQQWCYQFFVIVAVSVLSFEFSSVQLSELGWSQQVLIISSLISILIIIFNYWYYLFFIYFYLFFRIGSRYLIRANSSCTKLNLKIQTGIHFKDILTFQLIPLYLKILHQNHNVQNFYGEYDES